MIDFHTHILPEMDDGSRSVKESLEMLRMERDQGITRVMLTPHFYPFEESPAQFLRRRQRAWEKLQPHLTPDLPKLSLGAEVQYFEGICNVPEILDLRIQGTRLLLLEMPFCPWTNRVVADVLELNRQPDVQLVLAHIERYLGDNSRFLPELLERNVLLQANTPFLSRWQTKRKALRMLKAGELRFLGSDCHNMKERKPEWGRLPKEAVHILENTYI